jgi:hypothetical protein
MTRGAPRPSGRDCFEWALVCLVLIFVFGVLSGALAMSERAAWWR